MCSKWAQHSAVLVRADSAVKPAKSESQHVLTEQHKIIGAPLVLSELRTAQHKSKQTANSESQHVLSEHSTAPVKVSY